MDTEWIEHLKCRKCGKIGDVEIFEISPFNNGFRKVPDGFKVVDGNLHCIACGVPVEP